MLLCKWSINILSSCSYHRVEKQVPWIWLDETRKCSQGVHWVHVHPQGGEKIFFWPNLQGKVVSASPEVEQEFIFLGNWGDLDGGRGYLGSF